jgi:hypothetical protein
MSSDLAPKARVATEAAVVNVHVPLDLMWDFDKFVEVHKKVLGKLGCMACTSGFDIRWRPERELIVNPELEVFHASEIRTWGR